METKNLSKVNLNEEIYYLKDAEARNAVEKLTPTIVTETLMASSWNDGIYSLASAYPDASYNLTMELNGDICTSEQCAAWNEAAIVGSATQNIVRALGTVPTIDIPVIIIYTQK